MEPRNFRTVADIEHYDRRYERKQEMSGRYILPKNKSRFLELASTGPKNKVAAVAVLVGKKAAEKKHKKKNTQNPEEEQLEEQQQVLTPNSIEVAGYHQNQQYPNQASRPPKHQKNQGEPTNQNLGPS